MIKNRAVPPLLLEVWANGKSSFAGVVRLFFYLEIIFEEMQGMDLMRKYIIYHFQEKFYEKI